MGTDGRKGGGGSYLRGAGGAGTDVGHLDAAQMREAANIQGNVATDKPLPKDVQVFGNWEAKHRLESILGRKLTNEEIAGMAGAQNGMELSMRTFNRRAYGQGVAMELTSADGSVHMRVNIEPITGVHGTRVGAHAVIEHLSVSEGEVRKGTVRKMVGTMTSTLRKQGVHMVTVGDNATGNMAKRMSLYGFHSNLTPAERGRLQGASGLSSRERGASSTFDLFRTSAGRKYIESNGIAGGQFFTFAGSASQRSFSRNGGFRVHRGSLRDVPAGGSGRTSSGGGGGGGGGKFVQGQLF